VNPVTTKRLRDGWKSVELREVGRIVTGSTPPKAKTEYYGGSFPFVKPPELRHSPVNDAEDKLSDKGAEVADVAPVGSVLVSCIGNLGKTGRATQPVAFNQQINAIIPHEPNASKWIFYAVQTSDFASQLANVASATTIAIVNKTKFSGLRIPLAPEDEQRQIVAEIEKQFTRLEAGVAGLRRVQANLKRYRAAVLKAACEGKLVPNEACLRQAERGRQAELARQEGRTLPAPRPGVFFVYALRCDNESIYIGQTQDLQKRWQEHVTGQAADWTSQHKPVLIVHNEECSSRQEAVAREKWLKTGFGRKWLRREIAAGRARQAGYETGAQLLERILTERRQKWNGKGKYKEPEKPDTINIAELPEGWSVASVEQLCSNITSGSRDWSKFYGKGAGTFVLAQNVRPMRLDLTERQSVAAPVGDAETERTRIQLNDLLVTIVGAKTGDVCRVPTELDDHFVCQSVALLRPVVPASAKFFEIYLASAEHGQAQWKRYIYGQGRPHLSFEQLRMTAVPLPSLGEQERIVSEVERCLSVVEELEAVVNANLQRATRLRQSILQQAFSGTLI